MAGGEGADVASAALRALVTRYERLIRSAVIRTGGARAEPLADDIQQKVVVAIWGQLRREQTIEHPASYVYRCAVRETIRTLRQHWGPGVTDDVVDEAAAPAAAGPARALLAKEVGAAIERALGAMQPERARAVRGHLIGLEVQELMVLHGWPYQKARNLIARGIADLRAALRAAGIDEVIDD